MNYWNDFFRALLEQFRPKLALDHIGEDIPSKPIVPAQHWLDRCVWLSSDHQRCDSGVLAGHGSPSGTRHLPWLQASEGSGEEAPAAG